MHYRTIGFTFLMFLLAGCSSSGAPQEQADVEDTDKEKIAQLLKQMEEYVRGLDEEMAQRQEAIQALSQMEKEVDRIARGQLKERDKEVEEALARMQDMVKIVAKARGTEKPAPATAQGEETEEAKQSREVRQALAHIEGQMSLLVKNRIEKKRENAMQTLMAMEESVTLLAKAENERREQKRREAMVALNTMDADLTRLASEPRPWTGWDKSLFEERYGHILLQVRGALERYREAKS